ncbi:uncharacterized protein CC84DRAFT_1210091 [Paraphaeosphaeria sporulosa]|uniref:Uncharacterized protein n=1 Tax=Paraphaeosphaeria sporulosa TaxID=1460663 RepID=A0A177BXZ4_9PLEO|nr:uncharacterized protein CC84DRAFT_1210091 [Paraphaeosphaeria sporulosa]OAF99820.1 hypothetical protein CC84DRAFT_1210091 [Paraphaeosphaeria sporulosa]
MLNHGGYDRDLVDEVSLGAYLITDGANRRYGNVTGNGHDHATTPRKPTRIGLTTATVITPGGAKTSGTPAEVNIVTEADTKSATEPAPEAVAAIRDAKAHLASIAISGRRIVAMIEAMESSEVSPESGDFSAHDVTWNMEPPITTAPLDSIPSGRSQFSTALPHGDESDILACTLTDFVQITIANFTSTQIRVHEAEISVPSDPQQNSSTVINFARLQCINNSEFCGEGPKVEENWLNILAYMCVLPYPPPKEKGLA